MGTNTGVRLGEVTEYLSRRVTGTANRVRALDPAASARWLVATLAGAALVSIGAVTLFERTQYWAPCVGVGVFRPPQACLDAMSFTAADERIPIWLAALALCVAALATRTRRRRASTALVLVFIAGPILDPGFPWGGWNTADTVPYTGVIPAGAMIVSGMIVLAQPLRSTTRDGR